ncbi:MAG TPA: hypothetical protein VNH18_13770 [Bryobacteraceae bacterium]|nr:hypothetical protein [Bryobacteraceae bacterium]
MADQIVVMAGPNRVDLHILATVANEFRWTVGTAEDPREVAESLPNGQPLALLFDRDVPGPRYSWLETVRRLSLILPGVRLIACLGFAEYVDWAELRAAGAFHALRVPFKVNEVRQSLGFILDAEKRLSEASANRIGVPPSALRVVPRLAPDSAPPIRPCYLSRAAS